MAPNVVRPTFITVPAGTKPRMCRGMMLGGSCCQKIYLSTNPHDGSITAIDCDVPGGRRPSESKDKTQRDLWSGDVEVHDGKGLRHMPNCPDRDRIIADIRARNRDDVPVRKRA